MLSSAKKYSFRFIIDEVLVICTHIKKLSFLKKSLIYNLKLIYLIIKNNKNTIGYTVFDKVKLSRYMKTSSIVKQKQSLKSLFILKWREY